MELGPVSVWPDQHFYFGGVNAVQSTAEGLLAYADSRRGGAAIVL
jgi:hypothetical protein